jgi:hypothetical protein
VPIGRLTPVNTAKASCCSSWGAWYGVFWVGRIVSTPQRYEADVKKLLICCHDFGASINSSSDDHNGVGVRLLAVLLDLQKLLIEQKTVLRLENPERALRISSGLHNLQAVVFLGQMGMVLVLLLVLGTAKTNALVISGWFLWIGLPLALFVLVFAERAFREEPQFLALLRYAILTATSSAVPAMLGGLAWRFEGWSVGVLALLLGSPLAFFAAWMRLEWLAGLVPQEKEP